MSPSTAVLKSQTKYKRKIPGEMATNKDIVKVYLLYLLSVNVIGVVMGYHWSV